MFTFIFGLIAFFLILIILMSLGTIVLWFVITIGLLTAVINFLKVKKLEPTSMTCPYCGTKNLRITTLYSGNTSKKTGFGSVLPGLFSIADYAGTSTSSNHIHYMHEAECQNCGYVFNFYNIDDVNREKSSAKARLIGFGIAFVVLCFITLGSSVNSKPKGSVTENSNKETQKVQETVAPEQSGITGIEPQNSGDLMEVFEYEISEDKVILKDQKKYPSTLIIESSYMIDGVEYQTDISELQVRNADTVIFMEGISNVKTAVFNGSHAKRVYFPTTMELVYDNTLAYLSPDEGKKIQIYYGGSQEQWQSIFQLYEIKDLDITKDDPSEVGQSIADKINKAIGHEYDSSQFEYFFNADAGELLNN